MYLVMVRTILNELFLGENRYKPFKDKTMSCFWGKRGSNQNNEPYLGENVSPAVLLRDEKLDLERVDEK